MDNISGDAKYTTDQELKGNKTSKSKKKIVLNKNEKFLNHIDSLSIDLFNEIEKEYKINPTKKLYDALITALHVVNVINDMG